MKDLLKIETAKVVRCRHCRRVHEPTSMKFITVTGNITLGKDSNLVSPGVSENGYVSETKVYCVSCFKHCILTGIETQSSLYDRLGKR